MGAIYSWLLVAAVGAAGDAQLYYFGSTWCEPCRKMQPTVERIEQAGFAIQKVDIDQHADFATRFRVSAVPSLVLVKDGKIADRIDQFATLDQVAAMLDRHRVTPQQRPGRTEPPAPTVRGQSPPGRLAQLSTAITGAITPNRPQAARGIAPRLQSPAETTSGTETFDQRVQTSEGAANENTANIRAVAMNEPSDPAEMALHSTVRLKVEDAAGHSFGTGTVIDMHGREALVLTCAHIFRESDAKGRIAIDRFDGLGQGPTPGTLISYDLDLDVALVSMRANRPIRVATLATTNQPVRSNDVVFSVGCNHGERPTVMVGRVNQIDKYLGPPNITASGRPVDGRSGGGLFNRNGELIGVCNAADPELDEGLYAALPRVILELDRNGLSFIHERSESTANSDFMASSSAVAAETPSTKNVIPPSTLAAASWSRESTPSPASNTATQASSEELVCVFRSPQGEHRVFVIQHPSRDLLDTLKRESTSNVTSGDGVR